MKWIVLPALGRHTFKSDALQMKLCGFAAAHLPYSWPLEKSLRDSSLLREWLGVGRAGNQEIALFLSVLLLRAVSSGHPLLAYVQFLKALGAV